VFELEESTEGTLAAFEAEPGMMLMSGTMKDWVGALERFDHCR